MLSLMIIEDVGQCILWYTMIFMGFTSSLTKHTQKSWDQKRQETEKLNRWTKEKLRQNE